MDGVGNYKSWADQVEEEEEMAMMEEGVMPGPPIVPIHHGIFFSII